MKMLKHETRRRWYSLSWVPDPVPTVLVQAHRRMISDVQHRFDDRELTDVTKEGFKFTSFIGDVTGERFGFDGALSLHRGLGEESPWLTFAAELPKARVETDQRCRDCGGSGKDRLLRDGSACYGCDGTKKEYRYEYLPAQAVSASLALLLMSMEFYDEELPTADPQLMIVRLGIRREAAHIGGTYGPELVAWLRGRHAMGQRVIPEMVQAMQVAFSHIMGKRRGEDRFRAAADGPNGWLNTTVPGDACGTNPHGSPRPGEGYDFSDHNVDHPGQLLALLAGHAALHDLVNVSLARRHTTTC